MTYELHMLLFNYMSQCAGTKYILINNDVIILYDAVEAHTTIYKS